MLPRSRFVLSGVAAVLAGGVVVWPGCTAVKIGASGSKPPLVLPGDESSDVTALAVADGGPRPAVSPSTPTLRPPVSAITDVPIDVARADGSQGPPAVDAAGPGGRDETPAPIASADNGPATGTDTETPTDPGTDAEMEPVADADRGDPTPDRPEADPPTPGAVPAEPPLHAAWAAGSAYNARFKPDALVTVVGDLSAVGTFIPAQGAEPGLLLELAGGEEALAVHAAPLRYLRSVGIKFDFGERLTVEGSWATIDGKRVLLAQAITRGETRVELRDAATGRPAWANDGSSPTDGDVDPSGDTPAEDQ